jgi:hypothetical protein
LSDLLTIRWFSTLKAPKTWLAHPGNLPVHRTRHRAYNPLLPLSTIMRIGSDRSIPYRLNAGSR